MTARLFQFINRLDKRRKTQPWPKLLVWAQRAVLGIILAYLIYRVTQIGWSDILGALPGSPWFYILSIMMFLVPVLCEMWSYHLITNNNIPQGMRIFSRKRVYNEALISYSGEAYLSAKLANIAGYNYRKALIAVKDNNLISALVSNSWTIMLVGLLLVLDRADILRDIWDVSPPLISSFAAVCIGLYGFILIFLRRLTSLNLHLIFKIGLVHLGKVLVVAFLQILQWTHAIPLEAMMTWLIFLTVQVLLKRIPGLPNADLVFLGVGLSLAGFAQSTVQEVAAILIAAAVMMQLTHLAVFMLTLRSSDKPTQISVFK